MKISIQKTQNAGNTFIGLVMSAFDLKAQTSVRIDPLSQFHREGFGTVSVDGISYDWFDRGDSVDFMEA